MSNVLTRAQYEHLIDSYHAEQRETLLTRFDSGNLTYGGPPDLDSRDWVKERRDERADDLAYELFERERLKRLSRKVAP